MKRLLAFLLIAILLMSTTVPVAGLSDENEQVEEIYVIRKGNSIYVSSDKSINEDSIRLLRDSQFESLYKDVAGNYYLNVCEGIYESVCKTECSLTKYDDYLQLSKLSLPEEMMNGIATAAAFQKDIGNEDAKLVLFISENETRGLPNTLPTVTSTWNGHTFHSYQAYFTGMSTGWQTIARDGATTQAALSTIKELVATIGGVANPTFGLIYSIFDASSTCLATWMQITGLTPIYGQTTNMVQAKVNYTFYLKYTYYYDPATNTDLFGCETQRAYITKIYTDIYLCDSQGGHTVEKTKQPNTNLYTAHYQSPEQTAYENRNYCWVEAVHGKIYNKSINFTHPSFTWPSDWPI